MGYLQQYIAARKAYEAKIQTMAPSRVLSTFIQEEKLKTLTEKLDQINGKAWKDMDAAFKAWEAYRPVYVKKIGDQIAKEAQKDKLKPTLPVYAAALLQIATAFDRDCENKKKSEQAAAEQNDGVKDKGTSVANAAAAAAAKMMLNKISDEFRKRRQKHLDVAITLEAASVEARKQAGVFHEALRKGVSQAVNFKQAGQVREAAGLKIASQGQYNKLKAIAEGAKNNYDTKLNPFFPERNMRGEDVAKDMHLDIPDAFKKDLDKISTTHAKIFTTATAHTAKAKRLNEECAELASDGESLLQQVIDIADGKDFGKLFVDAANQMLERVKKMLAKPVNNAEKLKNSILPGLANAVRTLEANAGPPDKLQGAQGYINTMVPFFKTTMADCENSEETARGLIEGEKKKMPPDLLRGSCGPSIVQAESALKALRDLNIANAAAAPAIMGKAEPRVQ